MSDSGMLSHIFIYEGMPLIVRRFDFPRNALTALHTIAVAEYQAGCGIYLCGFDTEPKPGFRRVFVEHGWSHDAPKMIALLQDQFPSFSPDGDTTTDYEISVDDLVKFKILWKKII